MVTLRRCLATMGRSVFATCLVIAGCSICHAQCVPFSERAPVTVLSNFSSNPSSLLRMMRDDNDKIESSVASYLNSDPSLLPAVRRLIADSTTTSKRAIGAGLRRAEMQCTASQPQFARKIADFVRNLGDNTISAGYVAVVEQPDPPSVNLQPTPSPAAAVRPNTGNKLFSGEWNTELADPFASMPLPQ